LIRRIRSPVTVGIGGASAVCIHDGQKLITLDVEAACPLRASA
jgi:hypothetical protein